MSTPKKTPVLKAVPASSSINLEDVKALISLVAKEQIHEFEFESGHVKFRIRKDAAAPAPATVQAVVMAPAPVAAVPAPSQTVVAPVSQSSGLPADEPGVHYITSPIVGTFYRAPSPNAAPYVQVGDFVKPGQTLCVVEAMKLMNEIECDTAGEVVRVLVENGQPVEYGERLFAIRVG
jgi:acetyl-CoA carboxylase biotin carboxyl carrier protein